MYYSSGNYEAFAHPKKPEGVDNKSAYLIGSGLAAVAALMYCSTYPRVTTDMGSMMGMKAFIAAVLGGIGITHDTDVIQQHGDGHLAHCRGQSIG